MQLVTRIKETQELWEILVPHIAPPPARDFALWCQRFNQAALQRAFMRISRKFPVGASLGEDGTGAYRYASSVMVNFEKAQIVAAGDNRGNH